MLNKKPDEQGWFWTKANDTGTWNMAFASTATEMITLFDGFEDQKENTEIPMSDFDFCDRHWYGPFNCPGGDFGQHTIVIEEGLHEQAELSGEAIVIQHVDFAHCPKADAMGSITITSRRSAVEAKNLIYSETQAVATESRLIRMFRELDAELDGVRIPASAAAVANAIRRIIEENE